MQKVLEMKNISKAYGGVQALKNVSFSCNAGEVHCLAGENGAGKSTLLKILSGLVRPDEGTITLNSEIKNFKSPHHAIKDGIVMVYQELTLIPELSVIDNVFLNKESSRKPFGINRKNQISKLNDLLDTYKIDLNPNKMVEELTVAQKQLTEILKTLVTDPQIIILDEPTSSLSTAEVEKLYMIVRKMKELGKSIIFISHRMEEVFNISDQITVLKDGEHVGSYNAHELNPDRLIQLMVGRELRNVFPKKTETAEKIVFSVKNLYSNGVYDASFNIREHEILGLAGLDGQGQTELLNALYGIQHSNTGEVRLNGDVIKVRNPWEAINAGIVLIPNDRKTEGLLLDDTVSKNITIANLKGFSNGQFLSSKLEDAHVNQIMDRLKIKAPSGKTIVKNLSGGNQQKVVLGKGLTVNPKVMLFNEPTRGIDVNTKSEIYYLLNQLATEGISVVICSSELVELIGICNRIIVMYEGHITGELDDSELSEENIMKLAVGLTL